ncbi:hypothetical protein pdam_00013230, partial [Pocillopora damicornis]
MKLHHYTNTTTRSFYCYEKPRVSSSIAGRVTTSLIVLGIIPGSGVSFDNESYWDQLKTVDNIIIDVFI